MMMCPALEIQPGDRIIEYLGMSKRWDENPLVVISVEVEDNIGPEDEEYRAEMTADGLDKTVLVTTRGPRGGLRTQYLSPLDSVELSR